MRLGLRLLVAGLLLAGAAIYFWPRDEARVILDRAITAHGGTAGVARCNTGRVKVEGILGIRPFATEIRREEIFQLPGRIKRVEKMTSYDGAQRTRVAILKDGQWRQQVNQDEVQVRPAGENDDKELLAQMLRMLMHLRDQGLPLVKLADSDVEGLPAEGIQLGTEEQLLGHFYFDKQTHLLSKWRRHQVHPETRQTLVEERLFLNYKPFDGIPLPTTLRTFYDGRKYEDLVVTQASFPDHLDASGFDSLEPR